MDVLGDEDVDKFIGKRKFDIDDLYNHCNNCGQFSTKGDSFSCPTGSISSLDDTHVQSSNLL